jgi:hypothetical protein
MTWFKDKAREVCKRDKHQSENKIGSTFKNRRGWVRKICENVRVALLDEIRDV